MQRVAIVVRVELLVGLRPVVAIPWRDRDAPCPPAVPGAEHTREAALEVIYPGAGEARELVPLTGTEFLFVCGQTDRLPAGAKLQEAWYAGTAWPAMEQGEQFLRARPDGITLEGAKGRALGAGVAFPNGDPVKRRLEQFRDRMKGFPVLDGVAFRHK